MKAIACFLFGACTGVVDECPGLRVQDAWVREAPPRAEVNAAYMTLVNEGDAPLALTAVASPEFRRAEYHRMWFEGDSMRMEQMETLAIPAKETLALEPGGTHIMLFGPDERPRAGDVVHIRLQCGAGKTFVDAPVRRVGVAGGHQ
jgi:copper(I)-binding protein